MASTTKSTPRIPPLQLALVLVVVMVGIGIAFYFMVYSGFEEDMAAVGAQLTDQQKEIASLEDQKRNLLAVQEKANRLQKRFELLEAKLPKNQEQLNEFLSAISQRAQNARITRWLRFEQGDPIPHPKAEQVDIIPIKMSFWASYDSATAFFWELSNMGEGVKTGGREQLVDVRDISFVHKKDLPVGLLQVSCTAQTFLYRGGAGADDSKRKRGR